MLRVVLGSGALLLAAACAGDGAGSGSGRPSVVVTTSILGDIVREVVGEGADVEVVLPVGADPHDFSPSARQAEALTEADLLVVNGAGLEEGMSTLIGDAAEEGTPTFAFADHVALRPGDPHIWTDPLGMVPAVEALGAALAAVEGMDTGLAGRVTAYVEELEALDAEIEAMLSVIPERGRLIVTNHESFGYFADRYDLEVVGAVIPSPTSGAQPSSADIDALADLIEEHGVRAIFVETTSGAAVAEALARSVGDIEVATLYTESLGDDGSGAETYLGMLRTDARILVDALT